MAIISSNMPTVSTWVLPVFGLFGTILSVAIPLVSSFLSNKSKSKALKKAGDAASVREANLLDMQNKLLEEGRPLREAQNEASLEATRLLQEDVNREAGTSETFKKGLSNLSSSLASFGISPDSSVFGEATGSALAEDVENVRSDRFKLAGLSRDTLGPALGLTGGISSAGTDVGNVALGGGLAKTGLIEDVSNIGSGLVKSGTFSNVANFFKKGFGGFGSSGAGDVPSNFA